MTRPLRDRTLSLAALPVDPDGRVRFPVFDGEEDVPCRFTPNVLHHLARSAGVPPLDPRDADAVRACLSRLTAPVAVRFGLREGVIEVLDVDVPR